MEPIGEGWKDILLLLESMLEHLPFAKVESIDRRLGMLSVNFAPLTNKGQSIILESVAFKLERLSATVCEKCGKKGHKRVDGLKERRVLCSECYIFRYNDEHEQSLKDNKNVLD